MTRILAALGLTLLVVLVLSYVQLGTPWWLVVVFLGGTLGPYMGLAYPFPVLFKTIYVLGLLSCLTALFLGVKARKGLAGQALVVGSIVMWVVLGVIGLGTGT